MGWLIAIAVFAGLAFIGWLPDYIGDRRRRAEQRATEERKTAFYYNFDRILSSYPGIDNSVKQFDSVIGKLIQDINNNEQSGRPDSVTDDKVITLPRDGDNAGKCPKCKTHNLVLRGGPKSGYIKCTNHPHCDYMKSYSDLTKQFQRRKETMFKSDFDKAYR